GSVGGRAKGRDDPCFASRYAHWLMVGRQTGRRAAVAVGVLCHRMGHLQEIRHCRIWSAEAGVPRGRGPRGSEGTRTTGSTLSAVTAWRRNASQHYAYPGDQRGGMPFTFTVGGY